MKPLEEKERGAQAAAKGEKLRGLRSFVQGRAPSSLTGFILADYRISQTKEGGRPPGLCVCVWKFLLFAHVVGTGCGI